jgi:hypothetical protein
MGKKLLIDLDRIRDSSPGKSSDHKRPEGIMSEYPNKTAGKPLGKLPYSGTPAAGVKMHPV